jgi:hypothetical protein
MLKFPTQLGVEIYVSQAGLICFEQESLKYGENVVVTLTMGQLRSLIKNADALLADAEQARKEYQEGLANETNS